MNMRKYMGICFFALLMNLSVYNVFGNPGNSETDEGGITTEEIETETEEVMIDETAPYMELTLEDSGRVLKIEDTYFFGEVDERNKPCIAWRLSIEDAGASNGLESVSVECNSEIAYKKVYGNEEEVCYSDNIVLDLKKVTVAESYEGIITVRDNSGNESVLQVRVCADQEGAEVSNVSLPEAVNVVSDVHFYNEKVEISVVCSDTGVGVKAIEWGLLEKNETDDGYKLHPMDTIKTDESGKVMLEPEKAEESAFMEQIYVRGVDLFDNVGEMVVMPVIVIENQQQHDAEGKELSHLTLQNMTETPYKDAAGKLLYAGDTQEKVIVSVDAADMINGVREIHWDVVSEKGHHKELKGSVLYGETEKIPFLCEIHEEVEIALKELEANNVVVHVTMVDFSGNLTTEEVCFSVDSTAPKIEVEFDETASDEVYAEFYNKQRTAKITVKDRNLDMAKVRVEITNTEGVVPEVEEGGITVNEDNPALTTGTFIVNFSSDGDYTMTVYCTDMANHSAEAGNIPAFTIDMTEPVIEVYPRNKNAQNGNYYNASQVMDIRIIEHNFASERIVIQGTVENEGELQEFPGIREWENDGDVHVATILCEGDGKYQFDVRYEDMAGNKAEEYRSATFYVDRTRPDIQIEGVEDKSANNGLVAPVIRFSDTNFDTEGIEIMISGANRGEVFWEQISYPSENGKSVVYSDVPREKEMDDVYTMRAVAKDMAGNVSGKEITFSVNRFGSVYVFSDELREISGKYVRDGHRVSVTEVNIDELEPDSIRVVVDYNGTTRDMEKGVDYQVIKLEEEGSWKQYRYELYEENFADDGRYIVTLYSIDKAGNMNENRDEIKQAEIVFGIDKTAPNVIPVTIESMAEYNAEEVTAMVVINDNLVLDEVEAFVEGEKCEVRDDGDKFFFRIPSADDRRRIIISARDVAGNKTDYVINDVLVTTNVWIRWYNNRKLFWGSIVGSMTLMIASGITIFLYKKKKKH